MLNNRQKRWSSLLSESMTFNDQARHAVEVGASIHLVAIPGMEAEHSFVELVLDDIPGWEEPLWASDSQWLYVRRPQGIWKTALPIEHASRKGMLFQRRTGFDKRFGGTLLGRDFGGKTRWTLCGQPTEPVELDFPLGVDTDGVELGAMLIDTVNEGSDRLTFSAGPAFGEPPVAWRFDKGRLLATGADGRLVAFPIATGLDLAPIALAGKLWLRFEVLTHPWMAPVDAKVST